MKITAYKPNINQEYENGFKNVYPYSDIGRVVMDKDTGEILMELGENDSNLTKSGAPWMYDETKHDIMVKFPKFYYKREWVGEVLKDSILSEIPYSATTANGYEIFPVFLREDGTIRDYVLYGAFKGVELNGQLRSITGYKPTASKTIASFRSLARQGRNTNFNVETYGMISMIQLLYKVAFQDLNSQAVLGNGWTSKSDSAITGSTMALGNRSGYLDPFANSLDKPDSRLSTGFGVGENGELAFYNKKDSDPMPIKTRNMNGLQKWEETEDYIIYIDKDAVMTTVENYVVGAYDLFMERKANVDSNESLMKDYEIEWTEEDDSKLMLDINNYLLSQPVTLEEDEVSPSLETKVVPTTYEACFRVDKKTKDVYVGEGYENVYLPRNKWTTIGVGATIIQTNLEGGWKKAIIKVPNGDYSPRIESETFIGNQSYFSEIKIRNNKKEFKMHVWVDADGVSGKTIPVADSSTHFEGNNFNSALEPIRFNIVAGVLDLEFEFFCFATKTATEKPFVKTVMPNCKLDIITTAEPLTHSFIIKDSKPTSKIDPLTGDFYSTAISLMFMAGAVTNTTNRTFEGVDTKTYRGFFTTLYSKSFNSILDNNNVRIRDVKSNPNPPVEGSVSLVSICDKRYIYNQETFKQLLIYKGNLTENELIAENNKSITLTDNRFTSLEFPSNGNQISLFGIEDFYGSIWSFVDGMIVKDDGYYVTNNPVNFGDIAKHDLIPAIPLTGVSANGLVEGYGKTIEKVSGKYKYMNLFNSIGATESSNYSDYLWSHRATQTNICLFGSRWNDGSRSGAFCLYLSNVASAADATIGARLVCLG
ncbi:MAG: hypothetical protein ACRC6E_01735 [Fusobacteriaceae bacterium]